MGCWAYVIESENHALGFMHATSWLVYYKIIVEKSDWPVEGEDSTGHSDWSHDKTDHSYEWLIIVIHIVTATHVATSCSYVMAT